jgi:choline-sulfatase
MNELIENGISYEHAYTSCPLCQPARASLWTSQYPHQTKVLSNLPDQGFDAVSKDLTTIGDVFSQAGYDCVHFGKRHDYGALRGFHCYEEKQVHISNERDDIDFDYETYFDINTLKQARDYLRTSEKDKPFFAVVDFQNPHNICSYIGNYRKEDQVQPLEDLPKLPSNFETEDLENRPEFIKYMCCAHRRQSQTRSWDDKDYRCYLNAYHYFIDKVDTQVGKLLQELKASGKMDDTLIVLTADHGEGMAAHRLVTKYGCFYNESNEVPLAFYHKKLLGKKRITGNVSLMDIVPTITDFCGLEVSKNWEGISLISTFKEETTSPRNYVIGQWYDEFLGYVVPGRMYLDDAYKYTVYHDQERLEEELYSRREDAFEQRNLAVQPEYETILKQYRKKLGSYLKKTKDPFDTLRSSYDPKYRQHKLGYAYHQGVNATLEYERLKKSRS